MNTTSIIEKICPICTRPFRTQTNDRLYCSRRCRQKNQRNKEKLRDEQDRQTEGMDKEDLARYFAPPLNNPSIVVILQMATMMVAANSTEKPLLIRNLTVLPTNLPEGVEILKTAIPGEWIMWFFGTTEERTVEATKPRQVSEQDVLSILGPAK